MQRMRLRMLVTLTKLAKFLLDSSKASLNDVYILSPFLNSKYTERRPNTKCQRSCQSSEGSRSTTRFRCNVFILASTSFLTSQVPYYFYHCRHCCVCRL